MNQSRRAMFAALPYLMATGMFAERGKPLESFVEPFDKLPARQNPTNVSRAILDGVAHSGDHIEVHETTLAPGKVPHPPHQHTHEELFLMQRGTLEVTIAGKTALIGAGGAAFVRSGELHGVRNTGPDDAQYFVVAIGL